MKISQTNGKRREPGTQFQALFQFASASLIRQQYYLKNRLNLNDYILTGISTSVSSAQEVTVGVNEIAVRPILNV